MADKNPELAAALSQDQVRRRSSGAIEIQDSSGRRKTIQLDELTAADRELAAKFGYQPVRNDGPVSHSIAPN